MSIPAVSSAAPSASAVKALQDRRLSNVSFGGGMPHGLSNMPQSEQVKAVAGQFEAILLRQFLQESISGIMGGDKGGPSGNVYGYLLTDVLSSKIAEGGGLGLSTILQRQLTPRAGAAPTTPPTSP